MEALFIVALFLPALVRYLLALVGCESMTSWRNSVCLVVPLVAVGGLLLIAAVHQGVYGVYIPLMLGVFWIPQLAGIWLFACCDKEEAGAINVAHIPSDTDSRDSLSSS